MTLAQLIADELLESPAAPTIAPPRPATTPGVPKAPPEPSKPRPGTRPWSPSRRPGVAPRPKARNDREEMAFAESGAAVPPPPSEEGPEPPPMPSEAPAAPAAAPAPEAEQDLCDYIRNGDRVTILTPHGQKLTGRTVMRNRQTGCWVLNLGGRHGTPGIADSENIVRVVRGGKVIYGH